MRFALKLTVAAAAVAAYGLANAEDIVVKIGHVAPLSGPQAHYGKDNENGARMAIDDLNAKGVKIGGKTAKFELASEDDAADPKQGTAVAQKLCDAKVNGVVGHLNSGTTLPAAKIYDACGIPEITPAATNPTYSTLGYKYAFRDIANDNALGAGMAMLAKSSGAKTIAVIDDRTAYGQGVAEVFRERAVKEGLKLVSQQYTNDKATDFMAILTGIKAANPDVIFYGGMDAQAGPMLRQLAQLGIKSKFMGGDGICTQKLIELSGNSPALANTYCAEGGLSIQKMPGGQAWKKRYDAKYPGQFQIYSPYVYDAVMVLADAMERAGSSDPKVYGPLLSKTNYKGVTTTITFTSTGELTHPAITISNYKGGKKVALD